MTREEFLQLCCRGAVLLDGATGSNLMERGMPSGVCPEQWILENPEVLIELQQEFLEAGSDILYAPTFTASRPKLKEYGLESRLSEMNRELCRLSREAVRRAKEGGMEREAYVAADLTMTGLSVYPMGPVKFEELTDIYKEQVRSILEDSPDLFVIETMMSLQETRAAVLAVKESCSLPVMVTLTFHEDGRTLYGTNPETAAAVMDGLMVDAVGVNCSSGPEKMYEILQRMGEYTALPLIAKPNAGLPHLVNGRTVYDMNPELFAEKTAELLKFGASLLGGCCGTTPEHIRRLYAQAKAYQRDGKLSFTERQNRSVKKRLLTTERNTLTLSLDGSFMVVGERINPTGKKALKEQLGAGEFDLAVSMAEEQEELGAAILDINVGMNGIDEVETMQNILYEVLSSTNLPLCIDSSNPEVIARALRIYPGRALINSISMEKEKMEKLLPLAKKYGAMFILLPLSEKGLPEDLEEKKTIIHTVMEQAFACGLTKESIIVDGLATTVGANPRAAREILETIRYCKEQGLATICGLSNISFGLPERAFLNSAFLAMAIQAGLTMAIANPSQELLMNLAFASDLLMDKEDSAVAYIERAATHPMQFQKKEPRKEEDRDYSGKETSQLYQDVLKGSKKKVILHLQQELSKGRTPSQLIDTELIPAITETGRLFDQQIYFLPQLINSAETMKQAVEYLEPLLSQGEAREEKATVVMATVAGDIHDIGKNLVCLMLKNYGYRVIDLGKDVKGEEIVRAAKEEKAQIIGLSALMTTTMVEMRNVIKLVREAGLSCKVIVGGAVITQGYADEIGADGYSRDAQEAVQLAERLLS